MRLVVLVRHLRVGDGSLAVKALQRFPLPGVRDGVALLSQLLVHFRVDPAHEKARHARDLAEVASILVQLLQAREVSLHNLVVALDGKDQRDVDVVALGDLVLDGRQAFLGGRNLDHHVGPLAAIVEIFREFDRRPRAVGDGGPDLDAHESVLALGPVVHGPEDIGSRLHVLDHQVPQHVGRFLLGANQLDHGFVVVGRAADGLFEDRRVGRDAGDPLVAQAGQLARADQLAADVVQPQRLPDLTQLLDRSGFADCCRSHHFPCTNFVAAATMCRLEMPAAFISSIQ